MNKRRREDRILEALPPQKIIDDLNKVVKEGYMDHWPKQNNAWDKLTNFIYSHRDEPYHDLDYIKAESEKRGLTKEQFRYAVHRWYNHVTSTTYEKIFWEFGAVPHPNENNHSIDFYLDKIPYDLKVTVFPRSYQDGPETILSDKGREELSKWYYTNQSSEGRKEYNNRIFLVSSTPGNQRERYRNELSFIKNGRAIADFCESHRENGPKVINIDKEHTVNTAVIPC